MEDKLCLIVDADHGSRSLQEYQRTEKGIEGSSTYKESLTRKSRLCHRYQNRRDQSCRFVQIELY